MNGFTNVESKVKSTTALDSAAVFALVSRRRRKGPAWLLSLTIAAAAVVVVLAAVLAMLLSSGQGRPAEGPETLAPQSAPAPVAQDTPPAEPIQEKAARSSTNVSSMAAPKLLGYDNTPSAVDGATRVTPGPLRTIIELIDPAKPGEPDPL